MMISRSISSYFSSLQSYDYHCTSRHHMRSVTPLSLINKIGRSHSKNSYEFERLLVHEDDQVERSKILIKKLGSTSKGCMDLFVGEDEKKYSIPHKYFFHPKLYELLKKNQGLVFDPRAGEPIVLECSTETFEQLLMITIVKNRK